MNLDIEIGKRNNGCFFHKNKGIKSSKDCKRLAFQDILK
jgi:hypothetical protein